MVLKWLAIVLGALIAVGRAVGFIFPELVQKIIAAMIDRKLLMLVALLVLTVLGAFFIGLSHEALQEENSQIVWQAVVLLIVGIYLAAAGLLFLAVPKLYNTMLTKAKTWSPMTIRLVCLAGVIFGIALLLIGVTIPFP